MLQPLLGAAVDRAKGFVLPKLLGMLGGKLPVAVMMRLAGGFYVLKAFLLLRATSVIHISLTVLLQFCSYGFLFPSLYYFSKDRIPEHDMAKGQTLAMSMYTLGLALGSYAGGQLLNVYGLKALLIGAMLFASTGALIVNLSIRVRHSLTNQ